MQRDIGEGKMLRNPKSLLTQFLKSRDYKGAETVLNSLNCSSKDEQLWSAYFHFQNQKYEEVQQMYISLSETTDNPDEISMFLAICYFHMKLFDEAMEVLETLECKSALKVRLQLHLAYKMNEDSTPYLNQMSDSLEDRLSKAALLYNDGRYEDATDAYKELLDKNSANVALNVAIAMCHFKNVSLQYS
jgi:thioredoxin-like negative regulator of GroEL